MSNLSKKNKVLAAKKKSRQKKILILSATTVVALLTTLFVVFAATGNGADPGGNVVPLIERSTFGGSSAPKPKKISHQQLTTDGDAFIFEAADFDGGEAQYFSYDVSGKTVKFFLLKSSDGVVRAAFDACDVCYHSRRGYRQEGDIMVCNNCGQQFPSVRINVEEGGCNPSPLRRSIDGNSVVINISDINQGVRYF